MKNLESYILEVLLQEAKKKKRRKKRKKSDPKVGTGKKPKGSGRRLYTDENPKDTVSVKFRTVTDIRDTLSKKSLVSSCIWIRSEPNLPFTADGARSNIPPKIPPAVTPVANSPTVGARFSSIIDLTLVSIAPAVDPLATPL